VSPNYLEKLSSLLSTVADYVDQVEHDKMSAEKIARDQRITRLSDTYERATGEALPSTMSAKLASMDIDALDYILKVARTNADEAPASLGGPVDLGPRTPTTTKEAASYAEDNFLSWIIS